MVESLLAAPGFVAPGSRIYAVGDVHGCAGRLDSLHGLISADLAANPVPAPILVHLGDYIDRGPDSAGVVARLVAGSPIPGVPVVNLRGNHEQMMLDALGADPGKVDHWQMNGAAATLASWGIKPRQPPSSWAGLLPARDLAWLRNLPFHHAVDGYLFVHAGIKPNVMLESQDPEDLLWIREDFLDWSGPYWPDPPPIAVVHGHTPASRPEVTAHRINVDTGAVKGGKLTCAILEGRTVRFLQA